LARNSRLEAALAEQIAEAKQILVVDLGGLRRLLRVSPLMYSFVHTCSGTMLAAVQASNLCVTPAFHAL
jgi:hypothetical protein